MTHYAIISKHPYGTYGNGARCITSFGEYGNGLDSLSWPWYCDINNIGDIVIADTGNGRIQTFQPMTFKTSIQPYYGAGSDALQQVKSVKKSSIPGTNLIAVNTACRKVSLLRADYSAGHISHIFSFGEEFFQEPTDAATDSTTGNMVIVDTGSNRVSIHDHTGNLLGFCQQPHFEMIQPSAVAIARNGHMFVSDTGNHCIREFKSNGQYIASIGRQGSQIGQFNSPRGIAFDRRGYMYIADEYNNRVQMMSPDLTHFSEVVTNLSLPKGVAANKHLIVTSADNNGFVKVYNP